MIWTFLKQNVLSPKALNWVQQLVSRTGLLTIGRMGAVLVLVAMTAVWPTAGVTRTAPWFAGRDLQQQQYMTRIQITNKGPPITAAFVASDKSYHHLNIPTTKNTDTTLLEDMFKQIKPALKQHFWQISLAVHFFPHPRTGHWKHKEWCATAQIEMISTFSFIVYI